MFPGLECSTYTYLPWCVCGSILVAHKKDVTISYTIMMRWVLPLRLPTDPPTRPPRFGAEFWGPWFDESISSHLPYLNLTWKAVRVAEAGGQGRAYK